MKGLDWGKVLFKVMVVVANRVLLLSPEEYLEWEERSEVRHEFIDGEVFAMAGSSDDHAAIVSNACVVLIPFVRKCGCRLFPQDVKARPKGLSRYYYPDLMVTCDERDRADKYVKRHYKLIVEVLSDSTEAFDRGRKFEDYRRSESLEEYVLIAQDRISVDVFRLNAAGRWELEGYGEGDVVELVSVGARFAVEELYLDVELIADESMCETQD
ncbi:MAG: Uma2 family endonuclease [Alkalinema sp. CAN_BIN05]|nr:Uma2 family endonuclease [Alkalinema sp. CAN_BIN05]